MADQSEAGPLYGNRLLVAPTGGERSECQPCGLSVEDRNEVSESTEKESKARKSFERLLRLRNSSLWPGGSDLPGRSIRSRSPLWEPAFGGTHGRIRTSGLPLRRRPLYPAELRGRVIFLIYLSFYYYNICSVFLKSPSHRLLFHISYFYIIICHKDGALYEQIQYRRQF